MKKVLFGGGVLFCIILGGLSIYWKLSDDHTAPEISFGENTIYMPDMSEADLLADVTATDNEDGDVTESLVIETITVNAQDNTAIVVYVARDSRNNIAKVKRVLFMSDLEAVTEYESEKESELETEKSDRVKITNHGNSEMNEETEADIESESETESELETESESETELLEPGHPVIKLTADNVTIEKGESFNPLEYVASIEDDYDDKYSLWRDIQLDGEYDVNTAGTYTLSFYVLDSSGNRSNTARFKLIVKN